MIICEGLFFIVGLIALIAGKFRLIGKRSVEGTRARIIGLVLILPGPVAFILGLVLGASGGMSDETLGLLTVIEALMIIAAFVAAIVLTITTPEMSEQTTISPTITSAMEPNTQRLMQLKEMREKGLISEQEYQTKKNEILNRI